MNPNAHATGPVYHGGRRPHDSMPYNPQALFSPHMYHYHPQHVPQPYHHQPPQQWAYYNMQPPMGRHYQQPYPQMMNNPYAMAQAPSMSPRPNPQHIASTSSGRSQPSVVSPPPVQERPVQSPQPPAPINAPTTSMAPQSSETARAPFYPPLPWYSRPDETFPPRRSKRRIRLAPQSPSLRVELPALEGPAESAQTDEAVEDPSQPPDITVTTKEVPSEEPTAPESTNVSEILTEETPITPTTSTSSRPVVVEDAARQTRKVVPIVPVIPNLPSLSRPSKSAGYEASTVRKSSNAVSTTEDSSSTDRLGEATATGESIPLAASDAPIPAVKEKSTPKSWADLVKSQTTKTSASTLGSHHNATSTTSTVSGTSNMSKADLYSSFNVHMQENHKLSFLKPRGLINTGNMCYMNSILQVLAFCVPFYDFLDQVRRHAAYSFKTETPMVDAMIMFIREFPIIDSASSSEQLNLRLKDKELEDYGEPFTPEFVYDVIKRLPRFSSMRRGHQQDAEEFLGFLLEQMHEECVQVMKGMSMKENDQQASDGDVTGSEQNGWLEVGPKQRAAITRSSGIIEADSPITKIFGGKLRSEFRVPGAKNSVTLEPYQPLQLDIGSPHINNITDALKGLTRSETLHGDFNSPRGPGVSATKQVFVETMPPVLILHLKRFQYDNTGGTQKIWKRVGYPLELEIPKEVFPPHKRGAILAHGGLPKYRLIGVVYHHGKNASGGHYTVDVRRQNDREWIRLDDTVIRRIRSEDVAEAGSGEDSKTLATVMEQHKHDENMSENIFDQISEENEHAANGWSQVNGTAGSMAKKLSGLANGVESNNASGQRGSGPRYSIKDNKVAYILFYQKLGV